MSDDIKHTGIKKDYISQKVHDISPSGIRKYFDLLSTMEGAISLGVGEPDFVTPWPIREAGIFAIEKGFTMYTSNWGMIELRQSISQYLKRFYNISYNPHGEILDHHRQQRSAGPCIQGHY